MIVSRFGLGLGGQPSTDGVMILHRKDEKFNGTSRGIVYHHGRGGTWKDIQPGAIQYQQQALAEAGFIVVAPDDAGNLWSNPAAMTNVDVLVNWMRTATTTQGAPSTAGLGCKTDKVAMLGYSMGGLTVLNYIKRNPTKVIAAQLFEPATNLDAFEANATYQSEILAAYGATAGTWAAASAGFSPYNDSASGAYTGIGIPISIHQTDDDAVVSLTDTQTFVSQANDGNITLTRVASGLHGQALSYWSPSEAVKFFLTNA